MVTSKKFHISLVLLFVSGILGFIGSFSFVTNINGIPHAFDYLGFFELFSYIFVLIAAIRLRKVNRYFFYAYIIAIISIGLVVSTPILYLFNFVPAIDAIEEGILFSSALIDFLGTIYIVLGLRDCYNKDEDVAKKMSHAFFYAILISAGARILLMLLSSFDFLYKNFYLTMVSNMLSYLMSVGTATILLICYSRAMYISHKTLMANKAKGIPDTEVEGLEKEEEEKNENE